MFTPRPHFPRSRTDRVSGAGGGDLWCPVRGGQRATGGRLLDLEGCRFEHGSLLGHPPRLAPDGNVMMGDYRWEFERWGLPAEEIELPIFGTGQYYGRFMLKPKPGSKPSLQARLVAVTFQQHAAAAGHLPAAEDGEHHGRVGRRHRGADQQRDVPAEREQQACRDRARKPDPWATVARP